MPKGAGRRIDQFIRRRNSESTLLNIHFTDKFNGAAPSITNCSSALANSGTRRGALTPRVFWPVLGFNVEHRFPVFARRRPVAALVLDDPSSGVHGA